MANVYVYSGAGGAGTGVDWANAYTTIAAAIAGQLAGDNFWIANDHAETQASALTLSVKGTVTALNTFICVNRAGSVPPVEADLATTATVTTTGNFGITIQGSSGTTGYGYFRGITFSAGSGAVNPQLIMSGHQTFELCKFISAGTSAQAWGIAISSAGSSSGYFINWNNCTVQFGNVGSAMNVFSGVFRWTNTASAIAGATIPTNLFYDTGSTDRQSIYLNGVDLSALGANTIVRSPGNAYYRFENCKLGTSYSVSGRSGTNTINTGVDLVRCDSGATNYIHGRFGTYTGDQSVETTIVRTGGATDGTTPISWKIVTTANSLWLSPFACMPITIWNDTTAANRTVTVYGIWGGAAVPNNNDIWMTVEYLGSSLSPLSTFATTGLADYLGTAAGYAADTSTWGGSTTPFKMVATLLTPQPGLKGPIVVRIYAAKATSTFYIDPLIVLS